LIRLAEDHRGKHVVVEGLPRSAEESSSGKVFRIEFSGPTGDDGLLVVYFPANDMFARMEKKFGGTHGSGVAGKRLRIRGDVEVYQGHPEIRINSPEQIQVAP